MPTLYGSLTSKVETVLKFFKSGNVDGRRAAAMDMALGS